MFGRMSTINGEQTAIIPLIVVVAAIVFHVHLYNSAHGQVDATIQSLSELLNENITKLGGPTGVVEYEGTNFLVLHASGPWVWIAADIAEDYGFEVKDLERSEFHLPPLASGPHPPPEITIVMERSK